MKFLILAACIGMSGVQTGHAQQVYRRMSHPEIVKTTLARLFKDIPANDSLSKEASRRIEAYLVVRDSLAASSVFSETQYAELTRALIRDLRALVPSEAAKSTFDQNATQFTASRPR